MPAPVILFRCAGDPPHENDIRHEHGELRCGQCGLRVIDLRNEKRLCPQNSKEKR